MMSELPGMNNPMDVLMDSQTVVETAAVTGEDRIMVGATGRGVEGAEVGRKCDDMGLAQIMP